MRNNEKNERIIKSDEKIALRLKVLSLLAHKELRIIFAKQQIDTQVGSW